MLPSSFRGFRGVLSNSTTRQVMEEYFQIRHSAHPEHPLVLVDLEDTKTRGLIETQRKINSEEEKVRRSDGIGSISCNFCCNEMSKSSAYICITCDFYIHKLCAKLPTEMMHPDHIEHPLTLARYDKDQCFICDICDLDRVGLNYKCGSCEFVVDGRCAAEAQAVNHKGHRHPLRPLLSKALFKCHACATEHSGGGVSYKCNTCPFWVHEDCATLPPIIKYHQHVHPLSLVIPHPQHHKPEACCPICEEDMFQQQRWHYECDGCFHLVHVNCLARTIIRERNNTDQDEVDDDIDLSKVFRLPLSFQYDNLVAQMIEHMITHYYGNGNIETVGNDVGPLSHLGHEHPLTLCNVTSNSEGDKDLICNACVLPVSMPQVYYSCTTCNNYILHEWCAKLPNELLHINYPHYPLFLQAAGQGKFGGYTKCSKCECYSNGFVYLSRTHENLHFDVTDINCISLPPTIWHNTHQHPLKLIRDCYLEGCVACPLATSELAYGCRTCCFFLHYSCALQPITIVHRYDVEHPFILVDAPIEDGQDEYVCEFCEEDIDPKRWWFYHCRHCDQSACAECIFNREGRKYDLNPHFTYSSKVHDHPLAFVQVDSTYKNSLCSTCLGGFLYLDYALRCGQCNIMFHDSVCLNSSTSPFPLVVLEEPSQHCVNIFPTATRKSKFSGHEWPS